MRRKFKIQGLQKKDGSKNTGDVIEFFHHNEEGSKEYGSSMLFLFSIFFGFMSSECFFHIFISFDNNVICRKLMWALYSCNCRYLNESLIVSFDIVWYIFCFVFHDLLVTTSLVFLHGCHPYGTYSILTGTEPRSNTSSCNHNTTSISYRISS